MSEDYINNAGFDDEYDEEDEFELSDAQIRLNELIHEISSNPDYDGCIFNDLGWYFIVINDEILLLSDTDPCSLKCTPISAFTGPSQEEHDFIEKLMDEIGFNQYFFDGAYGQWFGYDEDDFYEYFADGYDEEVDGEDDIPEDLAKFKAIIEKVNGESSPFESMDEFVGAVRRYDLDPDVYYYEWEGDFIDLYENIADCGESYEDYFTEDDEFEEWIETLENIDNYKL